jgi:hypothetical protein
MSRNLERLRMHNIDCLHGVFSFHHKSIASRQILTEAIIIYKWRRKHARNVYLACPLADQVNIDFCGCKCRKYLVLNLICVRWLLSWLLQLLQTRLTCSADHIAHPLANNRDNIHVFQYRNLFLTTRYIRSPVESRKKANTDGSKFLQIQDEPIADDAVLWCLDCQTNVSLTRGD